MTKPQRPPQRPSRIERDYLNLLEHVRDHGYDKPDRTGTKTFSLFAETLKADLSEGFPLLTTKKLHWKSIVYELLWFLRGDTNIKYLNDHGVKIWDAWQDEHGELGPVYGKQWRAWASPLGAIDQISILVDGLKNNPHSRRHLVSAWNVADLPYMALAPCHFAFQCYVTPVGTLDLQVNQRSADIFLGLPFNIASYALLLKMLAQVTGYEPGILTMALGDVHLYKNHVQQSVTQSLRRPRSLPAVTLNPDVKDLFAFTADDIHLEGYDPYPKITAPVAV